MLKQEEIKTDVSSAAKYAQINRRVFLKGALAVGGALALTGCGEKGNEVIKTVTVVEPKTVTVTDTKTKTVTVTDTKTVTVSESTNVPTSAEAPNMVTQAAHIMPVHEHCSGCKLCMFECSIYHYGTPILRNSNIQVYCHDLHRGTVDIAILCQHCNDSPCMAACPTKVAAISLHPVSGAIVIDHDKCTLCGNCIEACEADRTGCLHLDLVGEKVVGNCDFCDLNPSCVKYCPEDALRLAPKGAASDGKWWAHNSYVLAEQVYRTVFGDYYTYLPIKAGK